MVMRGLVSVSMAFCTIVRRYITDGDVRRMSHRLTLGNGALSVVKVIVTHWGLTKAIILPYCARLPSFNTELLPSHFAVQLAVVGDCPLLAENCQRQA